MDVQQHILYLDGNRHHTSSCSSFTQFLTSGGVCAFSSSSGFWQEGKYSFLCHYHFILVRFWIYEQKSLGFSGSVLRTSLTRRKRSQQGGPDDETWGELTLLSSDSVDWSGSTLSKSKRLLLSPNCFTPVPFLLIFLQIFFVCVNIPDHEDSGEQALQILSLQWQGAEPQRVIEVAGWIWLNVEDI